MKHEDGGPTDRTEGSFSSSGNPSVSSKLPAPQTCSVSPSVAAGTTDLAKKRKELDWLWINGDLPKVRVAYNIGYPLQDIQD